MGEDPTEIGSIEFDRDVIHEQDELVDINLTREVTPEDIEEFGQHYLELMPDFDSDPIDSFKGVDVIIHPDDTVLFKLKEGAGWAGLLLGQDVTFTLFDMAWDDDEEPIRVFEITDAAELRALPTSRRTPEGHPFESAALF